MIRIFYATILSAFTLSTAVAQTNTSELMHPLFFDVQDKSLKISSPHIQYDLQTSKGEFVDFGNGIIFNDNSLKATIENNELHISWDTNLVQSGELTFINEQGQELWKRQLSGQGSWVFKDLKSKEAPQWSSGTKFHLCLKSGEGTAYANLCTGSYAVIFNENKIEIGRSRSEADPRVIFNNDEHSLKGDFEVKTDTPTQFLATLKTNSSFDFVSLPNVPVIKDMVQAKESGKVTLTGEMPRPLKAESINVEGEKYGKLTRALGFEKTIAEQNDLWQMNVPEKGTTLFFPGKTGGIFVYKLEIQNPPNESERLYLTANQTSGTYLSHDQFVLTDAQGVTQVVNYDADKKWAVNKITHDKSYLEVYRGSSGEASLRLTGVSTSNGNSILMGEGHVSWWFNDIFGWQNQILSKQRWGVSAKYFSSLMDFPISDGAGKTENVMLSALQADIRYRLNPGFWERDETVGLIGAYETVHLGSDNISKMGAGLFWARSMPRSIDKWFSKLPYMNYPKWVDMEVISFLSSPDSDVNLKGDFILNFHGKVLWTPAFFGEAGFGVKNYNYEFKSSGYGAKLTTYYGTLGIGLNF
ncbi:MAG: hypothetical protein ACXVCP_13955 [Bdellovibrio sp.]